MDEEELKEYIEEQHKIAIASQRASQLSGVGSLISGTTSASTSIMGFLAVLFVLGSIF